MATECYTQLGFGFQPKLVVDFSGGTLTTDAGLLLVREFDDQLGLSADVVHRLTDRRDPRYITHDLDALVRQRLFQIAAGVRGRQRRRPAPARSHVPNGRSRWPHDTRVATDTLAARECGPIGRRFSGSRAPAWTGSVPTPMVPTSTPRISFSISTARMIRRTGHSSSRCFMAGTTQHMYHPLVWFEGRTGLLLRTRLRLGRDASAAGVVQELRHILPPLRRRFPHSPVFLRGDADGDARSRSEARGRRRVLRAGHRHESRLQGARGAALPARAGTA
jgi:Transposase DDE domain group 1